MGRQKWSNRRTLRSSMLPLYGHSRRLLWSLSSSRCHQCDAFYVSYSLEGTLRVRSHLLLEKLHGINVCLFLPLSSRISVNTLLTSTTQLRRQRVNRFPNWLLATLTLYWRSRRLVITKVSKAMKSLQCTRRMLELNGESCLCIRATHFIQVAFPVTKRFFQKTIKMLS